MGYTDDELIAMMNRSEEPFVIVEGPDDVKVYRWILESIDCYSSAFIEPRGGCKGVQNIYERRDEIKNSKFIFICDRDQKVYEDGIVEPEKMIYTEGYSIENDLYAGRKLETILFDKNDKECFENALESFIMYYACQIEKLKRGEECNLAQSPWEILNHDDYSLLGSKSPCQVPAKETIDYLRKDYDLLLRGHSLFDLVAMILGRNEREVKYKLGQLYELCYKAFKSDCIVRMEEKIKRNLSL